MNTLLVILYVLVCLFLVMVVLLQQGKGADLSGAFGGGGTQTAFGPRSGTTLMHKLTTGSFVLFIVLSMALAILQGRRQRSVMEGVKIHKARPVATKTAPAAPAKPAPIKAAPSQKAPVNTAPKPAPAGQKGAPSPSSK